MESSQRDEITHVISIDETNSDPVDTVDSYDTPTQRASINQLSVDDLDAWLERIRSRRLDRVKKLEAVARIRADEVRLVSFLKYEKAYAVAKRALARLDEQDAKVEKLVHRCRLLALSAQMEAEIQDGDDTD